MPRPRLHVIHLLDRLRASGMERMLLSAAPHFAREGIDITVVGSGADHPYAGTLRAAGLTVRTIPEISSSAGLRAWQQLLREVRPDVVHFHSERNYLIPVLACRMALRRSALVRSIHSIPPRTGWHAIVKALRNRIADALVDELVACSPAVLANEESRGRRALLVWNWVDDRFLDAPTTHSRSREVMILGNCAPTKNHEAVLSALVGSELALLHIGSEEGATEAERRQLDAMASVGMLAHRGPADPAELFRRAGVLAIPSLTEGMSVSAAEALCAGVRVVISDAIGLQWSTELGASVAGSDWLAALRAALSAPAPAEECVEAARARFAASRGAREYAEIYRSIFAKSTGRWLQQ